MSFIIQNDVELQPLPLLSLKYTLWLRHNSTIYYIKIPNTPIYNKPFSCLKWVKQKVSEDKQTICNGFTWLKSTQHIFTDIQRFFIMCFMDFLYNMPFHQFLSQKYVLYQSMGQNYTRGSSVLLIGSLSDPQEPYPTSKK